MINKRIDEIKIELLKMYQKDLMLRDELIKSGDLYLGYHPKMEQLHQENSEKLEKIIYEIGWPTVEKTGEEASFAAWVILQNAISNPTLQRISLPLLMELANQGEIYPSEVAVLFDRICYFELRPQKYGTQFDFDEDGNLNPWEIEDVKNVDVYRQGVGLPPLNETIKRMQEVAKKTNEMSTKPYKDRINERKEWAKKVGWI